MKINIKKTILTLVISLGFTLITTKFTYAASAAFSLSPATGTYTVGNTFDINVLLNAGGAKTSGADMRITFTASKLKLVDIVKGSIYLQYPGKQIDNTAGSGTISGIANPDGSGSFSGSGVFATLRFQALAAGTGNVAFTFTQGSNLDSNVTDTPSESDILASATGGNYTIAAGSGSSASNPTQAVTNQTETSTDLPDAGNSIPVIALSTSGLIILLLGLYLLKTI